jgi:hypothetical protein
LFLLGADSRRSTHHSHDHHGSKHHFLHCLIAI